MTRTVPQSRSRLWKAVAAASLLLSGSALAQTPHSANTLFGAGVQNAKVQAAYEAWRRVAQSEVNCVDQSLRAQKINVRFLIQQGVGPSDAAIAKVRAGCRAQARVPTPAAAAVKAAPAAVAVNASQGAAAPAPSREYWSFNGSIMSSVAEGNSRKFYYLKPNPELEATGVKRGALALEGKAFTLPGNALSQRFVGIAYHLESRCEWFTYQVDGTIRDNNHRLELQGQKPRFDANCKVAGSELDALTFKSVDPAFAAAAAAEAAPEKAATDKAAVAEKAAASEAAAEAAAERAAATKAAEKAAADKAAAEKVAVEKAAAAKTAADKAAAEKAAAEKAAAEKIAADKAAAERIAAEKAAADKAAAEKAAAERMGADKVAAEKAAIDKAAMAFAKADPDRAIASAAAESRMSFLYGLICGPILICLGGLVFLFFDRRRSFPGLRFAKPYSASSEHRIELDRLVAMRLSEQKRRDGKQPDPVRPYAGAGALPPTVRNGNGTDTGARPEQMPASRTRADTPVHP